MVNWCWCIIEENQVKSGGYKTSFVCSQVSLAGWKCENLQWRSSSHVSVFFNVQAQAMVEIVKQLGWTYVSTVAAQGEYGEKVSSWNTTTIFGAESPMFEESAEKIKWYILCNCVQGIASFIQLARKSGVCIAVSVTINRNADDDQFDEIVNTLQKHDKARVSLAT